MVIPCYVHGSWFVSDSLHNTPKVPKTLLPLLQLIYMYWFDYRLLFTNQLASYPLVCDGMDSPNLQNSQLSPPSPYIHLSFGLPKKMFHALNPTSLCLLLSTVFAVIPTSYVSLVMINMEHQVPWVCYQCKDDHNHALVYNTI